jgi:hypothetical protein
MDALAGGLPAGGAAADEEDVAEVEDSTIYNDYECKSLGFGVRHPSQVNFSPCRTPAVEF